uniref:Aminotransferase class V domain-containing protein n=1 Tax=Romanomermis culicivorax TaxID=13658 RepID=A0A915LCX5_ROMCU
MASGAVYADDASLSSLNTKESNLMTGVHLFCWSNPLHPDLFPGCRKMEAEIVRMVTTGGTESILLACLAYRNLALEKGIDIPEIVVPVTAHAAFDKAAHLYGMKIVHIPLDRSLKVDIKSMRRAINPKTCMLVGSCPNFPHGIVDPIEDIAKMGRQNNVPVHVDACLGGFLVCFMENCGFDLKPFDFRVPGVTSISADTHKYAFAPKGTSVIMYERSRCGANIAVCWSTLISIGRSGYVEKTRKIIEKTRFIIDRLHKINGIRVLGEPEVSVVAFTSDVFNVYELCDDMSASGWNLNALQYPAAIHLCVTAKHLQPGVAEKFLDDVERISAELMKNPTRTSGGIAAMYGTSQSLPDRSLVVDMASEFLNACYSLPCWIGDK